MKVPLIRPVIGREEFKAIKKVLNSGFIAEWSITKRFEEKFAKFVGAKYCIATSSGTAAIHLSMMLLLEAGDEVIVPAFTFPATINPIIISGGVPVFCDIDLETLNIDEDQIEEKITERTKAILPVHMAGHSANMGPIMKIAKKYGLHVVEDAACGVGVKYKRKHVGTFGITGCFSFHPRKVLTTGEGGMITINKKDVYEKIYSLKNNGKSIRSSMVFEGIGLNYKMSDILAAVGIVQLKKVKQIIKKRVELAKYYSQYLNEKVEDVKPPTTKSYSNHTFQSYIVLIERENVRDKIILELRKKGIETQIGTFAVHLLAPYRKYTKSESFPNAEYAFRNSLILPLHHKMRKKDVEYVVDSLNKVLKRF